MHFIELISDYNVTHTLVEAPLAWSKESNRMFVTGDAINLPAIAITIAICFVLIIGIRETAIVSTIFVTIKIIVLLIFIIAGSIYVDRKNYSPFFPPNAGMIISWLSDDLHVCFDFLGSFSQYGVTGMLHASTFIFLAFVAFETVTAVAQEADTPSRSMPLALILSLAISLLLYVGASTVMVGLVPYHKLNTTYPLVAAM